MSSEARRTVGVCGLTKLRAVCLGVVVLLIDTRACDAWHREGRTWLRTLGVVGLASSWLSTLLCEIHGRGLGLLLAFSCFSNGLYDLCASVVLGVVGVSSSCLSTLVCALCGTGLRMVHA